MPDIDGIVRLETADTAASETPRPFAKAVRAGDFVFVSGQVPVINGEVITGGIVEQTNVVMQHVIDVIAKAACTLANVVNVNAWLDDSRDFTSFNAVFKDYLLDHPPARSTVQSALMVDAKVEMDVTAYKPS